MDEYYKNYLKRTCGRMESDLVDIIDQVRIGIGASFSDMDENSKQAYNLRRLGRILTNASEVLAEVRNLQKSCEMTGE